MITLHLHGKLADTYGKEFRLNAPNLGRAIGLMCANFKSFQFDLRKSKLHVVRGERLIPKADLGYQELDMIHGGHIHLVPVFAGSKSSWINIIIGIAMIALAFVPGVGPALAGVGLSGVGTIGGISFASSLALTGVMVAIGGIVGMLSPPVEAQTTEARDDKSFLFDGTVNTTRQGGPVPVVFGEFGVGSIVVSAGLKSEEIPV